MSTASILNTTEAYLAQSKFAQSPAAAGLDLSTEIIVCTPSGRAAEYMGTRAALEAEGVIPVGKEWPEGFDSLRWEDDKFRYWLRRERPEGIKGPRKQFMEVDWWMFRCGPVNVKSGPQRTLERKAKELADAVYRQSPEGMAEWRKQWDAYRKVQKDEKFQAFKCLIPGIIRPKRGHRPKSADQSQGASA